MTPIPLTSPAGVVYAYACSRCHHVSAGSSLWGRPRVTGPHEQLVEASLQEAERCCTCQGCGEELGAGSWLGRCAGCALWQEFTRVWADISTALAHGITSAEEWTRSFREVDEDDE